jgi:hypothetical protein
MKPPGTSDYTVIMHCPALSLYYGTGNSEEMPTDTKLAGLAVWQLNDSTRSLIGVRNFLNYNEGFPLAEVYGSQGNTVGSSAFIWA